MKKIILLLLSIFLTIFIGSCSLIGFYPIGLDDRYYVMRFNSSDERVIDYAKFDKTLEDEKLIIYVESGYSLRTDSLNLISSKFNECYDKMIDIYGNHTDVDNNGKIIILLLNINIESSETLISGYFNRTDLYGRFNSGEILYMDIDFANSYPNIISGTIFHELQHLINFNVNALEKGREMSSWLNEALSESASILFNPDTVTSRIESFNYLMNGYYCFYTWDLPLGIFANYPSASVFMNWIYQRSGNDANVFKKIASSSQNNDYSKIVNSVSYLGSTWEEILFNWIRGIYNNEVNGASLVISNPGDNIKLYPGALVVYNGSLTSSYKNLATKKLNSEIELALNKDTYIGGNPNFINITIPTSSVQSLRAHDNSYKPNKPIYIDVLFDADGNIKKY